MEPGGTGEIVCEVTYPPAFAGRHLTVFTRKRVNGVPVGIYARHDMGEAGASTVSVTGLEAGSEYSVYAILTNAPYTEAVTVSASVGVISHTGA